MLWEFSIEHVECAVGNFLFRLHQLWSHILGHFTTYHDLQCHHLQPVLDRISVHHAVGEQVPLRHRRSFVPNGGQSALYRYLRHGGCLGQLIPDCRERREEEPRQYIVLAQSLEQSSAPSSLLDTEDTFQFRIPCLEMDMDKLLAVKIERSARNLLISMSGWALHTFKRVVLERAENW